MKKNLRLLFFAWLVCALSIQAQQVILKGQITDSLAFPLAYANVIAKPLDLNKTLKFSITDDQGFYRLELDKDQAYLVSVSFMGFKTASFDFDGRENGIHNMVLLEKANQLEEIIIELPVIVKQDTVIYKTDHFVTGEERKLKNVLKKLPGVEVKKNGDVLVQGRKVTKMLVEGKKFFGGGSKLAVENIPANAVDKVQVIDNYNEVSFLKGLTDTDELAMNIQLKKDKKQFVFGDIEVGKGTEDYYRAHSNLFYYSPKNNINFIGNINNRGEKTFTFKDYMNFQGGVGAALRDGSSFFNVAGSDFGQFMETQDLVSASNRFSALNLNREVNNKLNLGAYIIFSDSETKTLRESLNTYNDFEEQKQQKATSNNLLGIGSLIFEYAPNSLEQWYLRTQFKRSMSDRDNSLFATIENLNRQLSSLKEDDVTYLNQNIEWHKKSSKKHTFSFALDLLVDQKNPKSTWKTNQTILPGLIPTVDSDRLVLQQLKEHKQKKVEAIFKHYWVLNGNNHLYTTLGNVFLKEEFVTNDGQILDNGEINDFSIQGFGNNLRYQLNDLYLGLHYKFRIGISTFKQGFHIHNYNWTINQESKYGKNKRVLLPDFLGKFEFGKSKKLQLKYQMKTQFQNSAGFTQYYSLRSYNSIFKGNKFLENELSHFATAYYSRFSMYRGIMFNAYLGYIKKVDGIRNAVQFDETDQYLSPEMLQNPEKRLFVDSSLSKKIKNINYRLGLKYSKSDFLQSVDDQYYSNRNTTYGFDFSAKTLFDNFPVIEIGLNQSIGDYKSGENSSKFTTLEPFLNIDYDFLKHYLFAFDYRNHHYKNEKTNTKDRYEMANVSLVYKNEESPWSLKIEVQNLFNMKYKRSQSFSSFVISDTSIHVLPRIAMLSIGYQL